MADPLYHVSRLQHMADEAKNNRIGTAFVWMSGALLLMMLVKEGKELIFSRNSQRPQFYEPQNDEQRQNIRRLKTRCFDREECCRQQRS